ncbi:hypothetical protein JI435_099310 [Parastagonospora nodorum SN15]|uniref:Uncharacterized protein n=1 Tax=Phaeosphaeria nodorum (strain SN15 / ATCC MYA-4574 / FGSC 10173) TaxID=321614 RepID=A0A7U2FDA4_PHANO|nr:hypothetical protein JI435_099310 [Parastagonospora nodorum SN15]
MHAPSTLPNTSCGCVAISMHIDKVLKIRAPKA